MGEDLMDPFDIALRVVQIGLIAGDPEAAHIAEDELYIDVLKAIADGTATNPQDCALHALDARGLDFNRWYA